MSESQFKEKPACAVKGAAVPDIVECPLCGAELEMWSDEQETHCKACNVDVTRRH
ncbi:MAG: hypothetical protein HQK97_04080 [Nitrospirae bacterium]|nr:hypothetical protein [Nitrospirota bacterium]